MAPPHSLGPGLHEITARLTLDGRSVSTVLRLDVALAWPEPVLPVPGPTAPKPTENGVIYQGQPVTFGGAPVTYGAAA